MKKIVAVLLLCAIAVSLSACHSKKNMTDVEYSEYVAAEQSKRVAESVKAEEMISEKMEKVSDDVGKTIKGKKLVLYKDDGFSKVYRVIMMDKDGNSDYMVNYYFAPTKDAYNQLVQSGKEDKTIYKKDAASRMVAFKNDDITSNPFDQIYNGYKNLKFWQIVE